jgi:hypothetical protein
MINNIYLYICFYITLIPTQIFHMIRILVDHLVSIYVAVFIVLLNFESFLLLLIYLFIITIYVFFVISKFLIHPTLFLIEVTIRKVIVGCDLIFIIYFIVFVFISQNFIFRFGYDRFSFYSRFN